MVVLAENSYPFEYLSLKMDNTFGLLDLNQQTLGRTTVFGQDKVIEEEIEVSMETPDASEDVT